MQACNGAFSLTFTILCIFTFTQRYENFKKDFDAKKRDPGILNRLASPLVRAPYSLSIYRIKTVVRLPVIA
jgi:hypothetical protein